MIAFHLQILSYGCRYAKDNKLPSPFERKQFKKVIKCAEEKVIRKGNYQIGKLHHNFLADNA